MPLPSLPVGEFRIDSPSQGKLRWIRARSMGLLAHLPQRIIVSLAYPIPIQTSYTYQRFLGHNDRFRKFVHLGAHRRRYYR